MKKFIDSHKRMLNIIQEQLGLTNYGMYWLAFLEGGLTFWFLEKLIFNWIIL